MAFDLSTRRGSPVLNSKTIDAAADYDFSNKETMTMSGFANKLIALVSVTVIVALAIANLVDTKTAVGLTTISGIVGLVLVLIMSFKPNTAQYIAIPYACVEGAFLSGLVLFAESLLPGVAFNALLATIGLLVATIICYRTGLIKVNEKFLSILKFAAVGVIAYVFFSLIAYFFMPSVSESLFSWTNGGFIGLGICVLLLVFGAMGLIADLYFTEEGIQKGLPKSFEWYCAMSVLITVVYVYVQMLELLVRIAYSFSQD
jgi:uncharacterized YccA/Bax inhibitor family protein